MMLESCSQTLLFCARANQPGGRGAGDGFLVSSVGMRSWSTPIGSSLYMVRERGWGGRGRFGDPLSAFDRCGRRCRRSTDTSCAPGFGAAARARAGAGWRACGVPRKSPFGLAVRACPKGGLPKRGASILNPLLAPAVRPARPVPGGRR